MCGSQGYKPGSFATNAATPLGRKLWAFLNDDASVRAMEVATDLGAPAVAGIAEALLRRFRGDVLDNRTKQMVGHMARQVMERRGFVVDQKEVKMNSVPFAKATRYRRTDTYQVHVFRNTSDGRDLCMTGTRTPQCLPNMGAGGRWRYWCSFRTKLQASVAFSEDLDELRGAIEKEGYRRIRLVRILRKGL